MMTKKVGPLGINNYHFEKLFVEQSVYFKGKKGISGLQNAVNPTGID